jgi:hypothetical protein
LAIKVELCLTLSSCSQFSWLHFVFIFITVESYFEPVKQMRILYIQYSFISENLFLSFFWDGVLMQEIVLWNFVRLTELFWLTFYAELIVLLCDFWWVFVEVFWRTSPKLMLKSKGLRRLDLKFLSRAFPKLVKKLSPFSYHYKFIPIYFLNSPFHASHQLLFSIIIKGSEQIIAIKITISRIRFMTSPFKYLQKGTTFLLKKNLFWKMNKRWETFILQWLLWQFLVLNCSHDYFCLSLDSQSLWYSREWKSWHACEKSHYQTKCVYEKWRIEWELNDQSNKLRSIKSNTSPWKCIHALSRKDSIVLTGLRIAHETKYHFKGHANGMPIGKKIPRKYVTNGKENFLACQFTLHLAAHYF